MKRTWFALLVASLVGCGEAKNEEANAPAKSEVVTAFDAEYRAASDEFGVPYELLRGMGFAQTNHHAVDRAHSHSGQAGVMGLQPAAVAEGARLLGASEAQVAADTATNIRAAAALIADRRLRGETWNGAALEAAGITGEMRARWLQKWARHVKAAGEVVPEEPAGAVSQGVAAAGEYPPSSFVAANSGNYTNASRNTNDVNFVIIHDVEGSYEGCISWFQNPAANVSAHYVVANEGDITQMVWEQDIAWHAGNWTYNEQSVGIEHEGYASDPNSYPESMLVASAGLTRYLTDKYSIPRTRDYVIAHKEVPGATHTDPGPYWEWDHYMDLVAGGGAELKAKMVGYVRVDDIYDGTPVANATVDLGDGRTATTDADGYYEIGELDPGLYTVRASAEGFDEAVDEKEIESSGGIWWKSLALSASEVSTGDDDDVGPTGGNNAYGGSGCSVAATTNSSGAAMFALLGLAAVASRRRAFGPRSR